MGDFILEDLNNCCSIFQVLREETDHISIRKTRFASDKTLFFEKMIAFLYSKICKNNKVKGIPLSQKFIENIIAVMEDTHCIHHSHVIGEVRGDAQSFARKK